MRVFLYSLLAAFGILTVPCYPADPAEGDTFWPQWRGPRATGVAPSATPPLEWTATRNVAWKTPLPGAGHSSPIVWGDHIFLTVATPIGDELPPKYSNRPGAHNNVPVTKEHAFSVVALHREDGRILWNKVIHKEVPHEGGHETGTLASASPVTDGTHVIAFFGSRGLYCVTAAGELVWKKHLGKMHSKHGHGEGASPALFKDTVVVNWDHEEQSFIVAFDKTTGQERWRKDRDEKTSWATPIIVEHEDKAQVIVSATNRIRSYDLKTGDIVWECDGLSANVVASPVHANGLVIAGSSYNTRAMVAVRLAGAKGDISDSPNILWKKNSRTPYVPSPLLYDNSLYFLTHYQGVLSSVHPETGETQGGPWRLFGMREIYASPVGAAGRVYVSDRTGRTIVLKHGTGKNTEDEDSSLILARNELGEPISASLAIAGKQIFIRGQQHLFCIAQPEK